ncbi:MAG TPA: alpha/beta hydrolase [Clostridiales bacterium]|nr:alpha/beta hydrolase [Clostridiales bacterium]
MKKYLLVILAVLLAFGVFGCAVPGNTGEVVRREGFSDYPIVFGESTEYLLDGILSIPDDADGRVPAVLLVHGSGPQDMDETISENKPFRDIAEYLAANGIAVFRYDKRTFSHGAKLVRDYGGSLTVEEETIKDALLAADLLKDDDRIDENKVFILGHSLGGMLAPRIHAEGGNFAGIISLAGSPRSLLDIGYDQQMAYINEMPEGEEKTAALAQMGTADEQRSALNKLSDEEAKAMEMAGGISFYYYKEMDAHPVSGYIEDIQVPFLIMQGEEDFQVYADKDYALWQELLAGRANASFKLYEGLNHLFIQSTSGSIAESQAEYAVAGSVDSRVLADIAAWVKTN